MGGVGTVLGDVEFFGHTEEYYREYIERPFLRKHLQTPGTAPPIDDFPAAIVFEVGTNQWRRFSEWPPAAATPATIHFYAGGLLSFTQQDTALNQFDEYISDPAKPVPYISKVIYAFIIADNCG